MKIVSVPIERVVPYERNPRRNEGAVEKVASSLREFGWQQPIVVDSEMVVVAGHTRLLAARRMGLETVPVHVAENLTPEQVRAYRIADNRTGEEAEWDPELLALELGELRLSGYDLDLTGFDVDEITKALARIPAGETDPDDVPDLPAVPVTCVGDAWMLGKHRLLCGDSTNPDDVARLLAGAVPDLANCDPPYGISVVKGASVGGAKPFGKVGGGKPHPFAGKKGRVHGPSRRAIIQPGVYEPVIGDDSTETAVKSYRVLADLGVPIIVLWGGNYFADALPPSRCWLVWDKENTGTFADVELAWTNRDAVARLFRHQWSGLIKASERGEKRVHPTQKPAALAEWVIDTVAPKARSVVDLFLGSGSGLIAAERKGIAFYGMELAPAYVDVSVKRWEEFTGQVAERIPAQQKAA
jgi:hypothetical protein